MKQWAGIQPYTLIQGELWLLVGSEKNGLWSSFSGGVESKDSTLKEAALREGYEELMGIFGTKEEMEPFLDPPIWCNRGVLYPLRVEYNPNLIDLFSKFVEYAERADLPEKEGFFEKKAIAWVRPIDIQTYPEDYRQCFLKTIDKVLETL